MLWILVSAGLLAVSAFSIVNALNSQPRTFNAAASADTYLSSYAPTTSYGTSTVLWVSINKAYVNWTLIQFSLTGRLRPGDLVVGATMKLTVSAASSSGWPASLMTARIKTAWNESTAMFATLPALSFDTNTSTSIGANGVPYPGATVAIDVSKQLKRWQSYGGPSNFGTLLFFGPDAASVGIGFASRENAQLGQPVLQVTFQPGPPSLYGYGVGLRDVSVGARIE